MVTSVMPEKGMLAMTSLSSSAEPTSMIDAPARSPANDQLCLMRGSRFSRSISKVFLTSWIVTGTGTPGLADAFVTTRNCMAMPPWTGAVSTPRAQLTALLTCGAYGNRSVALAPRLPHARCAQRGRGRGRRTGGIPRQALDQKVLQALGPGFGDPLHGPDHARRQRHPRQGGRPVRQRDQAEAGRRHHPVR